MKKCPYCAESIQDDAVKCRYCGEFLSGPRAGGAEQVSTTPGISRTIPGLVGIPFGWGYEYKSKLSLFGWPLVHIAQGIDPETRRPRVARGIIAIGNIAVGLFAMGGLAFGGLTFGGASIGVIALGGAAFGVVALGGLAVGIYFAVGGMAVSLAYAVGGGALAPCAFGGSGGDPACFEPLLDRLRDLGFKFR